MHSGTSWWVWSWCHSSSGRDSLKETHWSLRYSCTSNSQISLCISSTTTISITNRKNGCSSSLLFWQSFSVSASFWRKDRGHQSSPLKCRQESNWSHLCCVPSADKPSRIHRLKSLLPAVTFCTSLVWDSTWRSQKYVQLIRYWLKNPNCLLLNLDIVTYRNIMKENK